MTHAKITGRLAAEIVALYRAGKPIRQVAAETNHDYELVRRTIHDAGAMRPMGRAPLSRETVETVVRLYADTTIPPAKIPGMAGISRSALYLILEREGIPKRLPVPPRSVRQQRRS